MNPPQRATPAAVALNRFGLGARADDAPPDDPKASLLAQFSRYETLPAAWANEPRSDALAARFADARNKTTGDDPAAKRATAQAIRRDGYDAYRSAVAARLASALNTPAPFVERLVHFWANHFAVSIDKGPVSAYAGAFEMEAIRPHVLGRFEDMLVAVERHPAMQLFLDQVRSAGPDSRAARRAEARHPANRRGLNENLAREIMELHTLGVRTGYTQNDVTEFARALTGWSIAGGRGPQPGDAAPGTFVFRPALHEPGVRTVLGRTYDQPGEAQARAILRDLATARATSRHIAFQLARHFVADNPPPALTERIARAFETSGGDLPSVYRALVDAPEAWSPANAKFKTPWEWTVSSLRGLGWRDLGDLKAAPLLVQLGQPVWRPGSPAGYDDIAASWAAPDALVRRVEIAQRLAARTGDRLDPRTLGDTLLAGSMSASTATAVSRAESATTALALLLVSPDFQRR
ncbi:DUF1800 domain-containing protein [Burkholderia oklahomensis]|uniref:Uncharacterized protein n=2 Tax=Burkholderia oklahomensis TaxID=342113 RepID=A0AAI8BD82_9BURK|nr:DUF1800 domain-containing protein [Burkholderia oklahomensis]AIO70106.1 hypothetical protein DM82_4969 [Burkholderia oklahomensis]AOI39582.1 hypothetical protein WG70_08020 [Burkholderia oklahomensis EO147]KUY51513.1 hypothetical protein WG70_16360 [Burkholderia oklahomensis EO147]QPS40066.1 DUF1800 domain-containing protein [Burkholderia oklahomensis]